MENALIKKVNMKTVKEIMTVKTIWHAPIRNV
jgi:hypothetical protein